MSCRILHGKSLRCGGPASVPVTRLLTDTSSPARRRGTSHSAAAHPLWSRPGRAATEPAQGHPTRDRHRHRLLDRANRPGASRLTAAHRRARGPGPPGRRTDVRGRQRGRLDHNRRWKSGGRAPTWSIVDDPSGVLLSSTRSAGAIEAAVKRTFRNAVMAGLQPLRDPTGDPETLLRIARQLYRDATARLWSVACHGGRGQLR